MTINLPQAFLDKMQLQLGDEYPSFIESLKATHPTSIRLHPEKKSDQFNNDEVIPWCVDGRYLPQRPSFTFDPLFHAGCYYVQEASSMFLEQVYKIINKENTPVKILDLCAAPGGKSTHLLSLIGKDSLLISNEIIPGRNTILQQNLVKWGYPNVIVTQNQASDFSRLEEFFDIIVIDAPCSGEGLFRKDKLAINEWSIDNVDRCVTRQETIIREILPSLKPGGHIIYSTCTFEPSENDLQIEKAIAKYDLELVDLSDIGFNSTVTKFGIQCYPHKVKGEGFYIAALKKKGIPIDSHASKNTFKPSTAYSEFIEEYLESPEYFEPYLVKENLYAIPRPAIKDYNLIASSLYIRQAGICIGTLKGKDLIPAHDLALSLYLRNDLHSLTLNEDDAIRFLKCDSIPTSSFQPGWYTANFESSPMGWVKVLSSRVNNYFPRNLRILKDSAN